ncbi:MAG: CDP-diacylglycerol--serine O-phosphatidyltransferase [Bacteroidales bacterium]|nr:MAG: CDP-diacylglycerol--serine O-phosphatidyltransferase [Bacteroidales bacterium]
MISNNRIIKSLPNTITLLNLVAGCLSIVSAFEGNLQMAGIFILIAAVFDFFDGFTARLLGAYSPLGKELDSLSDVVSFGVAPAMILFHLLKSSLGIDGSEGLISGHFLLATPFIMAAFSSLRLGIFNLDERQTSSFIGLPTPANAMLTVGLVFGIHSGWNNIFSVFTSSPTLLILLILAQSAILVCELPMFSLKLKSLKFSVAYKQLSLIIGAIVLIAIFQTAALSLVILWYIFLSIFFWILKGKEVIGS